MLTPEGSCCRGDHVGVQSGGEQKTQGPFRSICWLLGATAIMGTRLPSCKYFNFFPPEAKLKI